MRNVFTIDLFVIPCSLVFGFVFSCCVPDVWEGVKRVKTGHVSNGKAVESESIVNISSDKTAQKLYFDGTFYEGNTSYNQIILQDYNTGKMYTVKNGNCSLGNVGDFPQLCTRPQDKKVKSSFLGIGDGRVQIDIYRMVFDNRVVEFTAQTDGCIPVLTYEMNSQSNSVVVSEYMGINVGIKDRNIFDIPSECHYV